MSDIGPLRVLVAYGTFDGRDVVSQLLTERRHDDIQACASGTRLVEQALALEPDLIITGIDLPELDGLSALIQISQSLTIPAIVITQQSTLDKVEQALKDHVLAYLLEPIQPQEILPTIHLVMRRFEEFRELKTEVETLKQALSDRKVIEQAKGMLMQRAAIDEETAYKRLRRMATDNRIRLIEAAQTVIESIPDESK